MVDTKNRLSCFPVALSIRVSVPSLGYNKFSRSSAASWHAIACGYVATDKDGVERSQADRVAEFEYEYILCESLVFRRTGKPALPCYH